ncbi:MAG: putative DEAH-box nuclear pre-mRNA splicing factor, partial [Streblomastix strix]
KRKQEEDLKRKQEEDQKRKQEEELKRKQEEDLKRKQEEELQNSGINPWTNLPYSKRYYSLLAERQQLPVQMHKKEFIEKFKDNRIVILVGQTGSGKSTQIPQFLVEMGYARDGKMIGCTQPR